MQLWYEFENHFLLELLQSQTCVHVARLTIQKKGKNNTLQIFPSHTQTHGFPPFTSACSPTQALHLHRARLVSISADSNLSWLFSELRNSSSSNLNPSLQNKLLTRFPPVVFASFSHRAPHSLHKKTRGGDCGHCRKLCKQMTESLFSPKLLIPQKWTRTQQYQLYFDAFVGNLTWLENN